MCPHGVFSPENEVLFFHLKNGKMLVVSPEIPNLESPHRFFFVGVFEKTSGRGVEGIVLAWNRLVCDVRIGPKQNQSPNECSFCGQELDNAQVSHRCTGSSVTHQTQSKEPKPQKEHLLLSSNVHSQNATPQFSRKANMVCTFQS